MDTLTVLAAWTGAVTGIGSLVVQYILHRRTGAVVKVDVFGSYDAEGRLARLWFRVTNRGRHAIQLIDVKASDQRLYGPLRRRVHKWVPVRWRKKSRRIRMVGALAAGGFPRQLRAMETQEFDAPRDYKDQGVWLDEVDAVHPYVRLGNGRIIRKRKIPTRRIG